MIRVVTTAFGVLTACLAATVSFAELGYYAVTERDGVSWFIDPQGNPFFSLGISDISPGATREKYNPERPAYAAFQHYDSTEAWAKDTIARAKAWNFNTFGSWVDASLTHGPLPYAVVLHLGAEVGAPWNDLFSDKFPAQMDKLAKARVTPRSHDRNLLGWFTDNELSWYPDSLFQYHLSQPGVTATRAKLVKILEDHYQHDFSLLERDFEIKGGSSFEELRKGSKLELRRGSKGRAVIMRFAGAVAERYYRVMHEAIRRYDANHLILGDRYAWHCPQVVAKAAGPFVDVISTNFDWPEASDGYLPCGYLRNLNRWTGRPVLVTEYYIAARENRSGNKNTGGIFLTVDTQQERADAAQNRLRQLVELPYVVGAHWFRYADEPTHGRPKDGEDYNFGLVDINNRPYDGLVRTMTQLHSEAPRLHAASKKTAEPLPGVISIPHVVAKASDVHKRLFQSQSLALIDDSLGVYELLAAWSPENLYLIAMICHVSERQMYSGEFRHDHTLELTIKAADADPPARIRFGGVKGTLAEDGGVKCWITSNGLRHTLVVAMSPQFLRKTNLKANDRISLEIVLRNVLDDNAAKWQNEFVLREEPRRAPRVPDSE